MAATTQLRLEIRQIVRGVERCFPVDIVLFERFTDDLAEFCQAGVDPRDRLPRVELGVKVPFFPVLRKSRRVIANPIGKVPNLTQRLSSYPN